MFDQWLAVPGDETVTLRLNTVNCIGVTCVLITTSVSLDVDAKIAYLRYPFSQDTVDQQCRSKYQVVYSRWHATPDRTLVLHTHELE